MARIVISNLGGHAIEVEDLSVSLLQHLQANRLDWMHSCGAKGRCTTCKVVIEKGAENLEAMTPSEQRYYHLGALRQGQRLACQLRIRGDVTIRVPHENKLPHVTYSD